MRVLRDLPVALKLTVGFGACVGVAMAIGVLSLVKLAQVNRPAQEVVNHQLRSAIAFGEIDSHMQQLRARQFRHILAIGKPEEMKAAEEAARKNIEAVEKAFQEYEASLKTGEKRQTFEDLKKAWNEYIQLHEQLVLLNRQGRRAEAERFMAEKMRPVLREHIDPLMARIDEHIERESLQAGTTIHRTYAQARFWIVLFLALSVLVCALMGWIVGSYINRQVHRVRQGMQTLSTVDLAELEQAMQMMEQGNLTMEANLHSRPLPIDSRDELGNLVQTYNSMIESFHKIAQAHSRAQQGLRELLERLVHTASEVTSASRELATSTEQSGHASNEIARGSEQLAQQASQAAQAMDNLDRAIRTVQQGSQTQREAAQQAEEGMRQAAHAVEEVARSAQQMAATAQQASAIAQQGGRSVEEMLATMRQIQQQAEASAQKVAQLDQLGQQIGNIVQTIEQIAEQTNLLALNAAIEAARAGEHGRGFAVVADEVRKLAEQAGAATKEIGQLIATVRSSVESAVAEMQATARSVADGFARSEQVGSALVQIVEAAQQVAGEVQSVTAVAEEMSASVQQVLATVTTVLQSAEENARAALEMASGSEQVSSAIASVASISEEAAASAQELTATSEEVAATAQELSKMAAELQLAVSQFNTGSYIALQECLHIFKAAHVSRAERLRKVINGKVSVAEDSLGDHTTCPFGKWYYGAGQRDFGSSREFQLIEPPHIRFHELEREVVSLVHRGQRALAEQRLAEVERCKQEIISRLDTLREFLQSRETSSLRRAA